MASPAQLETIEAALDVLFYEANRPPMTADDHRARLLDEAATIEEAIAVLRGAYQDRLDDAAEVAE